MAVLKIMNDIQDERQKNEARLCGDVEGVCYKDIDEFCESIPDDDPDIDIRLHCDGGQVFEGWAMYDRIRATGKNISVTVEGNAASMATVIMMAAPKERRYAYESAQICVHNPWMCSWWLPDQLNADDLQGYADKLRSQQQKMVDLYVDRCGCKPEDIPFNSIKVRLKRNCTTLCVSWPCFQFHKGAIETSCASLYDLNSILSIP